MYNSGYPVANFTWTDNSGATSDVLFSAPSDGLCVPFGFILAERGQPGEIYFGGANELAPIFGSETFNQSSPYFNPATLFMGTAMAGQGVCLMRLVDPDAETATFGLFAEVSEVQVVQYEKDVNGARIIDEDGEFVPVMNTDPTPVPLTKIPTLSTLR